MTSRRLSCYVAEGHLQNTNHYLRAPISTTSPSTNSTPRSNDIRPIPIFDSGQSSTKPTFPGTTRYPYQDWVDSYTDPSERYPTGRDALSQSFFDDRQEWPVRPGSPSRQQAYATEDEASNSPQWSEYIAYDAVSYKDGPKGIDLSPDVMVSVFESAPCFPGDQICPLPSPEGLDMTSVHPLVSPIALLREVQSTNHKSRIRSSTASTIPPQEGQQLLLSGKQSKCDTRKNNLTRSFPRQMPLEHEQTIWPDSKSNSSPELKPRVISLKRQASLDEKEARLKVRKGTKSSSSLKKGHSICEKRYRNKLNFKIAALRESIPHLHLLHKGPKKHDHDEEVANTKGGLDVTNSQAPSDKATIISKAIEYISFLEKSNERLTDEDRVLRSRIGEVERPAAAGSLVVRNGVIILRDCSILGA